MNFWDTISDYNTLWNWVAVAITLLTLLVLHLLKRFLQRRVRDLASRTRTTVDDLLAELLARTKFFFLLAIAVFIGSSLLNLPDRASTITNNIVVLLLLLQAAIWGNNLVSYLIVQYIQLETKDETAQKASATALTFLGRLILWSVLILAALDNLGFEITTLVASLGIGGIAVALAVQNILGDLFASLSIVLDQPFVVGDVIIVDEHVGTVEHIGLKTTRVRSLSGEQLIFANSDLLTSRIRNFKRMRERRIVFSFGVTYQTPHDKLARIPEMVQQIIEAQSSTRFDRAHFKDYGDSSLNFEVVYWIESADYKVYMDTQQAVNLELFQRFNQESIEFAYPTQTLYLDYQNVPGGPGR